MEYAFSIVTACFSVAMLLYAGLTALEGRLLMVRRRNAAKTKDKKRYARRFAAVVALCAAAPAVAAVAGLFLPGVWPAAVLIVAFLVCITIGAKWISKKEGWSEEEK